VSISLLLRLTDSLDYLFEDFSTNCDLRCKRFSDTIITILQTRIAYCLSQGINGLWIVHCPLILMSHVNQWCTRSECFKMLLSIS